MLRSCSWTPRKTDVQNWTLLLSGFIRRPLKIIGRKNQEHLRKTTLAGEGLTDSWVILIERLHKSKSNSQYSARIWARPTSFLLWLVLWLLPASTAQETENWPHSTQKKSKILSQQELNNGYAIKYLLLTVFSYSRTIYGCLSVRKRGNNLLPAMTHS